MKDSLLKMKERVTEFWGTRTKKQKIIGISAVALVITVLAVITFLLTRTTLVPLYSNLTPSETGLIKENLDSKGIENAISNDGTTISVPETNVDTLKVELAAEGIPDSGNIDYSFFGQNAGIGMTENEFNVVKLAAMQTEIANLIKKIEGIEDASVMITVPEEGIFVSDTAEEASASVILTTKPGYKFDEGQINALYRLVSKSVANLPTDNIVIMNQNFEYFDLEDEKNSIGTKFASQQEIKKSVEQDVQRQVQKMLGTLMGNDKVVVSVSADLDFTQETREEKIVTPVNEEDMEGIAISAQRINETYTGTGATAGGVPAAQDNADALGSSYVAGANGNGDYEKVDETINYEVNRINKQIVEGPYKVKDLGIQVMVEPPTPDDANSLPQGTVNDIQQILGTIIRTTVAKNANGQVLTDAEVNQKLVVSVQPFNGKLAPTTTPQTTTAIPMWAYIVGGVLLLVVIILLVLYIRSRKKKEAEFPEELMETIAAEIPDLPEEQESEASIKKQQLEKLAKEKPDDFAKLLRSWIAED